MIVWSAGVMFSGQTIQTDCKHGCWYASNTWIYTYFVSLKTITTDGFWCSANNLIQGPFCICAQRETTLQGNIASHWLGAYIKWSLHICVIEVVLLDVLSYYARFTTNDDKLRTDLRVEKSGFFWTREQENLIVPTDNIKVLGVTLDDHLKFDAHITNICITASRQINALKRLAKFLNERSRILIYKSFISSNFNYCPDTWMFCGRKNVMKLEKLQERALRFVFNDNNSSYVDLLKRGNFLSLSAYRIRNLTMEIFKCCHGMNLMYLNDLFCKQETKYDLRDKTLLEQPKFSTKAYGYRSFRCYGAKLWNALPFEIKNTDDYDDFKSKLTAWCHSSNLDKLEIFWFFPSLYMHCIYMYMYF